MDTTINNLRVELEAIASAHAQINDFFWGDPLRAIKEREVKYPLMCAYYTQTDLDERTSGENLVIVISDRVYKDYSNLNDTESDTHSVMRDIYNIMRQSRRWNKIGRVESASAPKFIDRWMDEVSGHAMQMRFTLFSNNSICNLPLVGYNYETPLSQQTISVNTGTEILTFPFTTNIDLSGYIEALNPVL